MYLENYHQSQRTKKYPKMSPLRHRNRKLQKTSFFLVSIFFQKRSPQCSQNALFLLKIEGGNFDCFIKSETLHSTEKKPNEV